MITLTERTTAAAAVVTVAVEGNSERTRRQWHFGNLDGCNDYREAAPAPNNAKATGRCFRRYRC